jgi:adenylate cyclase
MSINPGKLSRFWQELKRRRVVHVITVYASAAFVIIELINNLAEPLNLPSNLLTIVVIILAIGFPLAIILSWLYDLTSEGVEKTKPLSEVEEEDKTTVPNAWRIATYVSFVVIIGLVTFNIIGGTKELRAGDIQSLVILPFDNFTGEEDLESLVSGMHSSLITDLGRISGLRVLGKTTSSVFQNVDLTATDIASELNVDAVVEASVMCLGDSICIQFRLLSKFPEEKLLWVADYTEERSKILNLYNRITKQIADEVMIELTPEVERFLATSVIVDRESYDAYIQGRLYWDKVDENSLRAAIEYLEPAIEKDPNWAPLYAGLAQAWVGLAQMGYESGEIAGPKIFEYLNKALELDPEFPDAHYITAVIAVWTEWDWEKGEKEFLQAIAANPNDAMSRMHYAHLLMILQRPEEALQQAQLAAEIDPLHSIVQVLYTPLLMNLGDWEGALAQIEHALTIDRENFLAYSFLDMVAYMNEEYEKAFDALKFYLPFEEVVMKNIEEVFNEQGFDSAYAEVASLMVQSQSFAPLDIASRYSIINQFDKVLDLLELGFEVHDPNMPYIATGYANFNQLFDNPRFIALLDKMNLPPPKD